MLFQELGKLKRTSIMTSIIWMAVGVLMIICPSQYVNALGDIMRANDFWPGQNRIGRRKDALPDQKTVD